MKKDKRYSDKFCSKCGLRQLAEIVGAEKLVRTSYYSGSSYHPYERYDDVTGERNFVVMYRCPDQGWWNSHDKSFSEEIIKGEKA